jgi:hypothetical protein
MSLSEVMNVPEILDKQAINWRRKLFEEVSLLPDDSLEALYKVVHNFRLGLEQQPTSGDDAQYTTAPFAGAWRDMSDEDFADFMLEIKRLRTQD